MSLFGGVNTQARAKNLVEFKAGKMNLRGNMVHPDPRKGLVYLYKGNDTLMHLCWKDRSSNTVEDDLVIFPDEIEYKKVTQNTTGRVYILKWKTNTRKFFFWMQEPKDDQDEQFCKKINDFLNHPPGPGYGDSGSSGNPLQPLMERMAGVGGAGGIDPNDLSNVLRGMNPNDVASLFSAFGRGGSGAGSLLHPLQRSSGSEGGGAQRRTASSRIAPQAATSRPNTAPTATRTPATASTSSSRAGSGSSSSSTPAAAAASTTASSTSSNEPKHSAIQMTALTNVLANLNNSTTENSATAGASLGPASDETLIPLLSNKDVQEKLRAHLPESYSIPSTEKELKESIQSPEYRQLTDAFSTAFRSGELKTVLSQLNLSEEVTNAVNQGDLQIFIEALSKHYKNGKSPSDNTMDTN